MNKQKIAQAELNVLREQVKNVYGEIPNHMHDYRRDTFPKIFEIQKFIELNEKVSERQVLYHLVVLKLIEDTSWKNYVGLSELINDMRFDELIPFDSISDSTNLYGTTQVADIKESIEERIDEYRGCWFTQFPEYLEVWLEKDGLSDTVYKSTNPRGVFLSVAGGRTRVSQVHSCIKRANGVNKPLVILYLGDHDPTGLSIDENLIKQFEEQKLYIKFPYPPKIIRIAVTDEQTKTLHSTKLTKTKDSNYKDYNAKYGDLIWELDAFEPSQLQKLVSDALEPYRPIEKIKELEEQDEGTKNNIREALGI